MDPTDPDPQHWVKHYLLALSKHKLLLTCMGVDTARPGGEGLLLLCWVNCRLLIQLPDRSLFSEHVINYKFIWSDISIYLP
jgi:hypothetical protein